MTSASGRDDVEVVVRSFQQAEQLSHAAGISLDGDEAGTEGFDQVGDAGEKLSEDQPGESQGCIRAGSDTAVMVQGSVVEA